MFEEGSFASLFFQQSCVYQARRKIENEKNQAGRNDDFNYCFCPISDVFDFCFQYYIQTKILKIIGSSSR